MPRVLMLSAVLVTLAGCGGGDPCGASKCPNDAMRSANEYQTCVNDHQNRSSNKCYQQEVQYEVCLKNVTQCDSNGRTDVFKTLSSFGDCNSVRDTLLCCQQSKSC